MVMFRITVRCNDCKQAFRLQKSTKQIAFKQPTYCVYCASTNVGLTQDHELDADEVLAEHFNLSIAKYRQVVDVWEQGFGDEYPKLADFIAMLRARQQSAVST